MRKLMIILAALYFLGVLPSVGAAGPGSLRIELEEGGKPVSGARVLLCKAGAPVQGGYLLEEEFGGGFVTEVDVMLPDLARWLGEKGRSYSTDLTDAEGIAAFYGLEEGLYLVKQEENEGTLASFTPFLITIPWDGNMWEITASPKMERVPRPMPDTSDPGTVDTGFWGMAAAAFGLTGLLASRKWWMA